MNLVGFFAFIWFEFLSPLATSRARSLAAIIDSSVDGIVIANGHGKIVGFNPAAEKLFQLSKSQVIGQSLSQLLIPPENRWAHERGFREFVVKGRARLVGHRVYVNGLRRSNASGRAGHYRRERPALPART